jgi:hypothetical protein
MVCLTEDLCFSILYSKIHQHKYNYVTFRVADEEHLFNKLNCVTQWPSPIVRDLTKALAVRVVNDDLRDIDEHIQKGYERHEKGGRCQHNSSLRHFMQ